MLCINCGVLFQKRKMWLTRDTCLKLDCMLLKTVEGVINCGISGETESLRNIVLCQQISVT